jgi:hypothetical protein
MEIQRGSMKIAGHIKQISNLWKIILHKKRFTGNLHPVLEYLQDGAIPLFNQSQARCQ